MKNELLVTITSIKLRSVWHFFRLSLFGMKISRQAKSEKGFIKMKNTGFGYDHYTISVWKTEEDIKRFSHSGTHLEAIKQTRRIATEVRTFTYQTGELPRWAEVKKLLELKGKILKFN